MKTLIITALAIFTTVTMSAQDLKRNEVPSNLLEIFQKSYANASDIEWKLDGVNYKVEFDIKRMEHDIWYQKDGTIVKIEKDISAKELPSAVLSVIKSNYSGFKIDSVEMTEMKGKTTYEVELEKGWDNELKVIFDSEGNVLNSRAD